VVCRAFRAKQGVSLILNLHEWWLLRTVRVGRAERHELLAALSGPHDSADEVDLLAELGGYTLGKRSVRKDLPDLFDQLMRPSGPPVHGVAYGNRRYRRAVILAAALHQAGVTVGTNRAGSEAGCRKLQQFTTLASSPR
jgi:hypothetical protein